MVYIYSLMATQQLSVGGTTRARKSLKFTVHCPIVSMPLPLGPGIAISASAIFDPLPATSRANTCTLLFTDRFSRAADTTCLRPLLGRISDRTCTTNVISDQGTFP